ncbi:MAG: DinB family protein [bacterium]
MNWKELLTREIDYTYKATCGLLDLLSDEDIEWKPSTGSNWMTTGQLLMHLTNACGSCFKGFVTGDWGVPEGVDINNLPPEEMLPPAEKMPTIKSLSETKELLSDDKKLAIDMLDRCSEEELGNKPTPAPWDQSPMILGHRLLRMIGHLNQHKIQLYYYLKLQGKPVNTRHLYGM